MAPAESITADIIILGVGTCGEDLSLRLLGEGLQVVGIEASLVGGECAYWACLPSKMMLRAANLLQEARRVNGKAGTATVTPDWGLLAQRVRSEVTGGWDDSYATARFHDRGGRLVHGRGRLTGPHSVTVNGETFSARKGIVIATGSRPAIPSIPGLAETPYWTSHDVIQAEMLPQSILVLGGGAVGCELAQLMTRFGCQVTIVEKADRLLPQEEPEASAALLEALIAEGMTVTLGSSASQVDYDGGRFSLSLANGERLSAEQLLVTTGRRVDLSGLGLEAAGLDPKAQAIAVDNRCRAANGIWAMGDVTGVANFTHVAEYQSAVVAADILGLPHQPANYTALPRTVLTDPEIGAVGLTESQARAAGHNPVVVTKQLQATFRGWLHGVRHGVIKLVVNESDGRLLGATCVGPRGADMIGLLALAVHARLPVATLQEMIYAFPTFYGTIGEAIGAYGRGLSTVMDPGYAGYLALDKLGNTHSDPAS